jgi:hypothetical protein
MKHGYLIPQPSQLVMQVGIGVDRVDSVISNWTGLAGGLLLHDDGARIHVITTADVANLEFDKITSPQLPVEPQIKQGQLPGSMFDLQSHADVSQVSSVGADGHE